MKQPESQVSTTLEHNRAADVEAAWALYQGRFGVRTAEALARLSEAQNWRCCYCGCRMDMDGSSFHPTFEHVIPTACGGPDSLENLVIACRHCNDKRGSSYWLDHIEVLALIQGVPIKDVQIPRIRKLASSSTYSIVYAPFRSS